jgi:cobalt-precorrin 5A hydrolase/precorrin-3B C17-methyltransferase
MAETQSSAADAPPAGEGGTLYGLGIGPGDPDLITVKARDILARAPVVAYPAPEGGDSLVRAIAAPFVPAGCVEVVIATPMAVDRFPAQEVYDRYAAILAGHLQAGRDVAVLCEGDPFLYGSFMYIHQRLAPRFPTVVVPGVSSLAAVAAVAGRPLAARNEVFTVLPAPLPEAELEAGLKRADAVAIMKLGRHLPKVRRVLERLGLAGGASYVARATMAEQQIRRLDEIDGDDAPYFSMILTAGLGQRGQPLTADGLPASAVLLALSAGGAALARRLQAVLPDAEVHGLAARVPDADRSFTETAAHLQALFQAGRPIIGICAAGILIRALAPLLADKRAEPPVLAIAEDGSAVVPLLGGHHGANRLARTLAPLAGGIAAVTTAGDVALGLALDEPPSGWRVANPEAAKAVTAALLAGGEPLRLTVEAGTADWLAPVAARFGGGGSVGVRITDRAAPADDAALTLHPPVLAVGIGCERDAPADEVLALVREVLEGAGLAAGAVACVASLMLKADEPAVHAAAAELGVPARFFTAAELEAETPRLANPSDLVFREVRCHGVAEAAALAAAGPAAELVVVTTRSARATCAVARSPRPIGAAAVGRERGRLAIVGIGPGSAAWRTPEATRVLSEATDIVGYQLYLDLIADLIHGQRLHAPPMTEEEARARLALDLAGEGRRVALVSSGDAGVYGLAALAFELLDRTPEPAWRPVAVTVVPGISALLAAASRAGAPLGHDFCAISLSDLLTPWTDIIRRLEAAATGDFVVALYNPVSQRRRSQLMDARAILLAHRPAETPVILARNLGRPGETLRIVTLGELGVDDADMLTLVMIGSSHSRVVTHGGRAFVYTPRGYAAKAARQQREAQAGE